MRIAGARAFGSEMRRSGGCSRRGAGTGGPPAVEKRMKRVPPAFKELLTLVVVLAAFLVVFSLAFPTPHG